AVDKHRERIWPPDRPSQHPHWAPSPQLVKCGRARSGCVETRGISNQARTKPGISVDPVHEVEETLGKRQRSQSWMEVMDLVNTNGRSLSISPRRIQSEHYVKAVQQLGHFSHKSDVAEEVNNRGGEGGSRGGGAACPSTTAWRTRRMTSVQAEHRGNQVAPVPPSALAARVAQRPCRPPQRWWQEGRGHVDLSIDARSALKCPNQVKYQGLQEPDEAAARRLEQRPQDERGPRHRERRRGRERQGRHGAPAHGARRQPRGHPRGHPRRPRGGEGEGDQAGDEKEHPLNGTRQGGPSATDMPGRAASTAKAGGSGGPCPGSWRASTAPRPQSTQPGQRAGDARHGAESRYQCLLPQ
ncbi:hypothetical protein THAOC_25244, partial [Thalassiosira oceanica]